MSEQDDKGWVSNRDLQLELRTLKAEVDSKFAGVKSDIRLWVLGGMAGGQILNAVDVPASVSAAAFLAVGIKIGLGLIVGRGG